MARLPISRLSGLEGRIAGAAEDTISITVDPSKILFKDNKLVLAWTPMADAFRGTIENQGSTMTGQVAQEYTSGQG